ESAQLPALRELRRVVRPGGTISLLDYVRPRGKLRRLSTALWAPWTSWAYGAHLDRNTEARIPEAGLDLTDSQFVVPDLVQMLSARVPARIPD
ncbi:MAG TPA: hypothetical protein VMA86_13370, partial [Acetobacteraceae bacterium]|nr:hypothetical protein [Acetobacteraceae bacterium]